MHCGMHQGCLRRCSDRVTVLLRRSRSPRAPKDPCEVERGFLWAETARATQAERPRRESRSWLQGSTYTELGEEAARRRGGPRAGAGAYDQLVDARRADDARDP